MGLALVVTYRGYSKAFSAFTGMGGSDSGAVPPVPPHLLLGAVLSAIVAANIVAINFCFDVPVKALFFFSCCSVSLFLMVPDVKRTANLFVLNKPVQPKIYRNYLSKRWLRISAVVLKSLFIIFILYSQVESSVNGTKRYGDGRAKPPLFGIYNTRAAGAQSRHHSSACPDDRYHALAAAHHTIREKRAS